MGVALGLAAGTAQAGDVRVYLDRRGAECPTGFATEADVRDLARRVRDWDYHPQCIWETIQEDAADERGLVKGFAFGITAGLSRGVGYTLGNEIVVFREGERALRVGVVAYRALGADLTLPIGTSRSQSVIYGRCNDGLESYLGWFENYSALAKTLSLGRKSGIPFRRELTGCNAHTSTLGMTSSIVGMSSAYYWALGPSVVVEGPGVADMVEYLDALK
jgi:hypothetical protein